MPSIFNMLDVACAAFINLFRKIFTQVSCLQEQEYGRNRAQRQSNTALP
jgi:hypothetical protein